MIKEWDSETSIKTLHKQTEEGGKVEKLVGITI